MQAFREVAFFFGFGIIKENCALYKKSLKLLFQYTMEEAVC